MQSRNVISEKSFIAVVDDGSADGSWEEIKKFSDHSGTTRVTGIRFSRNFGHQYALLAGLLQYKDKSDAIITVDIDLQDDISVMEEMIEKFREGNEIVYGIRKKRSTDTFLKRTTAVLYYRILKAMKVDIFFNHADYRLTSRKANEILGQFGESDLFLRGIFPYIGLSQGFVYYDRLERNLGETKYSFTKMIRLAWTGILSFSSYPLDLVFRLATLSLGISFVFGVYILISYFRGDVISGWTSLSLFISFFGSVQLLSIGILSKYISKVFDQTKDRPRFILQESLENE